MVTVTPVAGESLSIPDLRVQLHVQLTAFSEALQVHLTASFRPSSFSPLLCALAVVSPPIAVSLVVLSARLLLEPCGSTLPAICVALPDSNPDAEAT